MRPFVILLLFSAFIVFHAKSYCPAPLLCANFARVSGASGRMLRAREKTLNVFKNNRLQILFGGGICGWRIEFKGKKFRLRQLSIFLSNSLYISRRYQFRQNRHKFSKKSSVIYLPGPGLEQRLI